MKQGWTSMRKYKHPVTKCEYCGLVTHTRTIGYYSLDHRAGDPIIEALYFSPFDPFLGKDETTYPTGQIVDEEEVCTCTAEYKRMMKLHLEMFEHREPKRQPSALEQADTENLILRVTIFVMVLIMLFGSISIWG